MCHVLRIFLCSDEDDRTYNETEETGAPQEEVGGGDLLIGDLLSLDYPAPTPAQQPVNNANQQQPVADLLGDIFGGMDVSIVENLLNGFIEVNFKNGNATDII